MILEARALSLAHGRHVVVSDVSFALKPGEMVAVIGANGSGKSTLLRGLARILKPLSGCILLDGKYVSRMSTREVAKTLAILPQAPRAPADLSVRDLVSRGRFPHQRAFAAASLQDRKSVEAALEAAGVSALAACPLGSLSGGELQMAWLALALAQEPRVLLLDEPTTSLDVHHQVAAMGLLRRLNREEGLTVVVVLHDLQLAAQFTDRVLALRHGRLEFDGPTGRVFTPPALERVFGVPMTVFPHPETGEPIALPSHSATSAISPRG